MNGYLTTKKTKKTKRLVKNLVYVSYDFYQIFVPLFFTILYK